MICVWWKLGVDREIFSFFPWIPGPNPTPPSPVFVIPIPDATAVLLVCEIRCWHSPWCSDCPDPRLTAVICEGEEAPVDTEFWPYGCRE